MNIPTGDFNISCTMFFPGQNGQWDPNRTYPLLLWARGDFDDVPSHRNHGRQLATWGFWVVMPELLFIDDPNGNADILSGALDTLLDRSATPGSPFEGIFDTSKVGVGGHGKGALAALVMGANDTRPKMMGLFEPVVSGGSSINTGLAAIVRTSATIGIFRGEDHWYCNQNGNSDDLYQAKAPPKFWLKLNNGNYCDFLNPASNGCELTCGNADTGRVDIVRKYMTAWFLAFLGGEPSYLQYLTGQEAQNDQSAGLIQILHQGLPIAPTPVVTATWTPYPTPTNTPTRTPRPTRTPPFTPTPRPTWTPSPRPSWWPTDTPSPTNTPIPATPTNTPTPSSEPFLYFGGYLNSTVSAANGGQLTLAVLVQDIEDDVIAVEAGLAGTPLGLLLYDNGTRGDLTPGDKLFMRSLPLGSGAPGQVQLTLEGRDIQGNRSTLWPYLTVRP